MLQFLMQTNTMRPMKKFYLTLATLTLAGAKTSVTVDALQQALTQLNGKQAIQGVSGRIAFDANGDALDKSIVILAVDPQGFIKMEPKIEGTFLLVL